LALFLADMSNLGTLQARDLGILSLRGSAEIQQGRTGLIQAAGQSFVELDGVRIVGGILHGPAVEAGSQPDITKGAIRVLGASTGFDLRSLPLTIEGLVEITNGGALQLISQGNNPTTSLKNTGTLLLNSTPGGGGNAFLQLTGGDVKLDGGGRVTLADSPRNFITTTDSEPRKLMNVDNTIEGAGNIGENKVILENQNGGTIRATSSNNRLIVDPPPGAEVLNAGTMEAIRGGTLLMQPGRFRNMGTIRADRASTVQILNAELINPGTVVADGQDSRVLIQNTATINTGTIAAFRGAITTLSGGAVVNRLPNALGNIAAEEASRVELSGGTTISGGRLTGLAGGVIRVTDSANLVAPIFNFGRLELDDGSTTTALGEARINLRAPPFLGALTLLNTGTIALKSDASPTNLVVLGLVKLDGSGKIDLSDSPDNSIRSSGGDGILFNVNNTISGAGEIGGTLNFINLGNVVATGTHPLEIQLPTQPTILGRVFNGGRIITEGSGGIVVRSNDPNPFRNAGRVEVQQGSSLTIDAPSWANTGKFVVDGNLSGNSFENGLLKRIENGEVLPAIPGNFELNGNARLTGYYVHGGKTTVRGSLSAARVRVATGEMVVNGSVTVTEGDQGVCVEKGAKLSGSGTINGKLITEGRFQPGKSPGVFTVNGDFEQLPGGVLEIEMAGPAAGTEYDRLVVNGAANVDGMVLIKSLDGFVLAAGGTFDVMTSTNLVDNGFTIAMPDRTLVQPAMVDLGGGSFALRFTATEGNRYVPVSGPWENAANWSGGTPPASGDTAFIPGDAALNTTVTGPTSDTTVSTLVIGGGDPAASTSVTLEPGAGTITATRGTTIRRDGRLAGQGTLVGDLYNAGTVSPGDSLGTLDIVGDYLQEETGSIFVELGGFQPGTEYDQLIITGTAALGGTLGVTLLPEISPPVDSTFEIVTARQIVGEFEQINLPVFPMDERLEWNVVYTSTGVMLRFVEAPEPGDFNGNGVLDSEDIDLLSAEVRATSHQGAFDLNSDTLVDQRDRQVWVNQLRLTFFGDSNLDGEFNSSDLVLVFQAGQYEDTVAGNATWATGDWNGDADFDSTDFVTAFQEGGYERGPRQGAAVPEPSSACLLGLAGCLYAFKRRRFPQASRRYR
jgi:hypothetical protein